MVTLGLEFDVGNACQAPVIGEMAILGKKACGKKSLLLEKPAKLNQNRTREFTNYGKLLQYIVSTIVLLVRKIRPLTQKHSFWKGKLFSCSVLSSNNIRK